MTARDLSLFEAGARLQMNESIELTIQSLQAHGADHDSELKGGASAPSALSAGFGGAGTEN